MKKLIFCILLIIFQTKNAISLDKCEWQNKNGDPCITVSKTPNSSVFAESDINKISITKEDIINSGALDVNDILKTINGLDVFQSGTKGQMTSIFTRGSESNHTLVLLNGIAINDQSVTDGLHDFGQDFISTIQQIDIYKGSNGAHFGPSAIAGAINFITDIDYINSYTVGGLTYDNFDLNTNYTKITNNNWHLNFKGSAVSSETKSAIANGNEKDGTKNFQLNFNSVKFIDDNLKFKSSAYSRKTKSDYDNSATDETGYVSDNKMYAIQTILEHKLDNSESDLKLHYHKYDRNYANDGFFDEYYSQSMVVRAEHNFANNPELSFGFGGEYKYDWGNFENRGSYNASTKGHMKNASIFSNLGYLLNDHQKLSFFLRAEEHNTTSFNKTYKINFVQLFDKLELSGTSSTGLRNPSLYELYGTDNYGIKGNTQLDPEKSKTNEIKIKYNFNENLAVTSTGYKTTIFDRIESNASYTKHVNLDTDIKQKGLENEITYRDSSQKISFFTNFSKSRKDNGQSQNRRPDLALGANYLKKLNTRSAGNITLNLNYKHTGKYTDWDGSKNSKQKSVDLVNLSLRKKLFKNSISLNITNLLDKNYQKPATYAQDGRRININLKKSY